ncbi:DNA-binding transcriptional regulator, IscR family [Paenibacillus sophorae]|uniref:DNA-binding transcriptional regulator, IscR family n=1 Tax=Paenibacillus sophorae TaxID=1333845 RepID=A0A1H8UPV0_9BACL|nr:Rrf2 family transcriptional regulator [Paenibacillus sophorae]QWU13345.1 Rrf2 family transcriptional regulator [Paenibacillus sophorae]SEP05229.1 DNA-binding transcriptional regulator, IscR family [Paenibacillus sophorae]
MNISTRFAVAIHILALLETFKEGKNTSEWIAGSVGTNPVVIRRITSMLGKAGLIEVRPGIAGAKLARAAGEITLLDIYLAVDAVGQDSLFAVHDHPNPDCPVGQNIAGAIIPVFSLAQQAMEDILGKVTLAQIASQIPV